MIEWKRACAIKDDQTGCHKGIHFKSLSEWLAIGLLTKMFKLLFSACHEETINKEIDKQKEEAKKLFDEIAGEIELTCAQGTIFIISTLGIKIEIEFFVSAVKLRIAFKS